MHPQYLSNVDIQSLRTLYPILDDYSSLELSTLAQKNSVAMSMQQQLSGRAKNGVRKVIMLKIIFFEKMFIKLPIK